MGVVKMLLLLGAGLQNYCSLCSKVMSAGDRVERWEVTECVSDERS
jgi:hypothetical protein